MIHGLLSQVLGRDDLLDDLLLDLFAQLLGGDVLAVLGADNNGVDSEWDNGSVVVLVLNRDLSLGIWSQPWQASVATGSRHGSVELVCQLKGQWEQLWGLIGGISKHDTLITSSQLLEGLLVVKTLSDIWGLLLNGDQNVTSLVIESLCRIIVSNILDSSSNDLLVIQMGLGGDFTKDHDHTGLGSGLASNLGERVLC